MNIRKIFGTALATCAIAGAASFSAAPAHAGAVDTELGSTVTLADNAGLCGGTVRSWVTADPAGNGGAFLHVQGLPFQGITVGGAVGTPCTVVAKLAWRNTTTGATGLYQVLIFGGPAGSPVYTQFAATGKGKISTELSTSLPNTGGRGEFTA